MLKLKVRDWLIIVSFVLISFGWIAYSFTQVDLNLTLSSNPRYQNVQHQLTQIGYYNRPLSTLIFIGLLAISFAWYLWLIYLTRAQKTSLQLFTIIIGISAILIMSYPAFSYDIFNYLFDARIVTRYHLNPAYFKALDFPNDEWTRFMRWTHRYYPYGPGWLLLTLVPSFIGMGKFVLTLGLFKIMFILFHVANCWLIYKISKQLFPKKSLLAIAFYSANPLVLIESILSPHNEVVMVFFTLLGIWYIFARKPKAGIFSLLVGFSIKYLSVVLLPFIYFFRKTNSYKRICIMLVIWSVALIPVVWQREPYSWYMLPILAIGALLTNSIVISPLLIAISGGLLMRYAPYLWYGDYGVNTQFYESLGFILTLIVLYVIAQGIWIKKTSPK